MSSPNVSPVASLAPVQTYADVTEIRTADPGAVAKAWQARTTRPTVRGNGRLMIVAADHPARGALAVGDRPTAMNSRSDLLDRLRAERGLTYIMVSHDLAVVAHMCDRLMVMQHGLAVEELTRDELRRHRAATPYTQQLLAASEGYKPAAIA